MTEKNLMNSIIEFLNYSGLCFAWRVNSGAIAAEYEGKKRIIRLAQKGTSDIHLIRKRDGKFGALEVKLPTTKNTVTENQLSYLYKIQNYNGLAAVVTSPEEALAIVKGSL